MSIDGRRNGSSGEWMSVHEAAPLMGVSPATLRRWSDAGDIRTFTTPGGHRRFSRSAIAGLLPDETHGPTADQLDGTRTRLVRAIHRGSRRVAITAPWSPALDADDRAIFAVNGRHMIDGLLAITDRSAGDPTALTERAHTAAAICGALAARRGLSLRMTVETCLRLRAMVVRELATAARRHDLDGPATSHWLESTTREIDSLVGEVMRGHELATEIDPETIRGRPSVGSTRSAS